jgi:outer membrane protein TolC
MVTICRKSVAGAFAALLLGGQNVSVLAQSSATGVGASTDPSAQLRPAINGSSAPATSTNGALRGPVSGNSSSGATGGAVPGPVLPQSKLQDNLSVSGASGAVDADFAKHKADLSAQHNSQPVVPPTQASGQHGAVVLAAPSTSNGPSAATDHPMQGDEITLGRPALQALVSINDYLNPFRLDSQNAQSMNLRDALKVGIDQNLDLAISHTVTKQRQLAYYSTLGNFLPDPTLGFSEYFLDGKINLPGSFLSSARPPGAGGSSNTTISLDRPFLIMHAGFQYYVYRGGSIVFGAMQAKHNYSASEHQERASLSDTLMSVTQNYYNLVLAEALLQIRIQAVRTSEEQLRQNTDRFESGLATNLDVLQSKTQLARDQQALVDQQIARRSAAIALATSLNADLGSDLIPVEQTVRKVRLVDPRLSVGDLLQIAIDHRPELRQYEELRLAAKKAIIVSGSNLQPTVGLSGNIYGIGPPSNVSSLFVFAVNANWQLKGFGTVDSFAVQQSRWQARQASLQSQKELQTVLGQVRNSLLQSLDKERNIEQAGSEVSSAVEELRLAQLRKEHGVGTNLDIITAQRDYTQALIDKAQAIINFNIAQAQLVHDVGLTSIDALSSGRLLTKEKI